MNTQLTVLDQIRYCDDMWGNNEDGSFIISIKDNGHYEPTYILPESLLAEMHPNLPDVVRTLIQWGIDEHNCDRTYSKEVIDTMAYIIEDNYCFTDVMGKDRTLINITNFKRSTSTRDSMYERIYVRGTVLELRSVHKGDKTVSFVVNSEIRDLAIHSSTMDRQYPGWLQRWKICEDLGLDFKSQLQQIFNKNMAPTPINIETINFE